MPREILVHLSVEASEDDTRTADEIADRIVAALGSVDDLTIVCPLAEDV